MTTTRDPVTGQEVTAGAGRVAPDHQAGERNPGSRIGADHRAMAGEWACVEVDHGDGDTWVWQGPALLAAIEVSEAFSAHAWTIEGSSAPTETIAASATLGTAKTFPPGGGGPLGQIMDGGIEVKPNASATTGKLRVWFRPLPSSVVWAS